MGCCEQRLLSGKEIWNQVGFAHIQGLEAVHPHHMVNGGLESIPAFYLRKNLNSFKWHNI